METHYAHLSYNQRKAELATADSLSSLNLTSGRAGTCPR